MNPSVKKWLVISALIGYAVLILFLALSVNIQNLVTVILSVNLGIYGLTILCFIISITFHSLVWFQLLKSVSMKLSFRRSYVLYWTGIFVDGLIPGGWSGDLFKAYLLSRDPALDGGKAVASVVAKNIYEAIFNLGSMILGFVLLVTSYKFSNGAILYAIGVILILLTLPLTVLLVISFKPEGAKKILAFLIRLASKITRKQKDFTEFKKNVEKILENYHDGMKVLLQSPKILLKPMVLSFFAWAFEVITLLLVFAALGQMIPIDKVIVVRSIAGNIEAQGYALAGYAHVVTTTLYFSLGINLALSASVAILGGLVIFWLKAIISYVAFHCTVFRPCSNFVCRAIGVGGVAGNKTCKENENGNESSEKLTL